MKKLITLFMVIIMVFCFVSCVATTSATVSKEETSSETFSAFSEAVIVDEQGVKFTVTSMPYDDSIWGAGIKVRLENDTDKNLMYALDNVSINGYMVNVLFATTVSAGKKENTSITIFSSEAFLRTWGTEAFSVSRYCAIRRMFFT